MHDLIHDTVHTCSTYLVLHLKIRNPFKFRKPHRALIALRRRRNPTSKPAMAPLHAVRYFVLSYDGRGRRRAAGGRGADRVTDRSVLFSSSGVLAQRGRRFFPQVRLRQLPARIADLWESRCAKKDCPWWRSIRRRVVACQKT